MPDLNEGFRTIEQKAKEIEQKAKELEMQGEDEIDAALMDTAKNKNTLWIVMGLLAAVGILFAFLAIT